jgi:Spy/CpxP family protein refolding chaperone
LHFLGSFYIGRNSVDGEGFLCSMKTLTILSLVLAGLCAMPTLVLAEDPVPPKPPGGTEAPKPAGDKAAGKPERRAGGPAGGGERNPAERLKMMTEKLNLTQDQQDKIKAIQEKNAPEFKELMAKGRENLTEADKTKLRELGRAQMEEIGAILTPEQKEKMKELREARGGDRKPGKPGEAK